MRCAVIGGKGGTGKTFIAVNLAYIVSSKFNCKVLLVDSDVENPSVPSALGVGELKIIGQVKRFSPKIIFDKCDLCGVCAENCPPHALILIPNKKLMFLETLCEGCAMCFYVCPRKAIVEDESVVGWIKFGVFSSNLDLLVGELRPGERGYSEIIEELMGRLDSYNTSYDSIIVDSPPGTGKPIKLIVESVEKLFVVTEPTRLGLHDLKKLYSLIGSLRDFTVILNKAGLKGGVESEIRDYVSSIGVEMVDVPFDLSINYAYASFKPYVELYPESSVSNALVNIARRLINS